MTHRIRGELNDEIENGKQLRAEITSLRTQLEESKAGLLAAARISDQLEISQVTNAALKEERKQKGLFFCTYIACQFVNLTVYFNLIPNERMRAQKLIP